MSNFTDLLRVGRAGATGDTSGRTFPGTASTSGAIGTNFGGFTTSPTQVYTYGAPTTKAANNVLTATAFTSVLSAVPNGSLATGGVATLSVPRCVALVSSNAGDTTQVATVAGTDFYGISLTSATSLNGVTAVDSLKAFKTVTSVTLSASLAGNLTLGTSDIFGLPYYAANQDGLIVSWAGFPATSGTFVKGDATTPATSATGDVRGTFAPASASDGTKRLAFQVTPSVLPNPSTGPMAVDNITLLYGVPEA